MIVMTLLALAVMVLVVPVLARLIEAVSDDQERARQDQRARVAARRRAR